MGAIEDTRKVPQDFRAPELRELKTRIDALEKRFDGVDRRFDEVERRAEKRHDQVMSAISQLAPYFELRERVIRLESKEIAHQ